MEKIYDLIIVGSGPAGLAAAIYASRAELDYVVLERSAISGGQVLNTYEVDNYPGLPGLGGAELAERFREHCSQLGAKFITGELINAGVTEENLKQLFLSDRSTYTAQTVIIATGAGYRKLGVPGEEELSGMGVSYCATCDGAFFKSRTVAVVGGGDVAVEDAIFLARMSKKVFVVHRREEFRAAKTLMTRLRQLNNVEILTNAVVERINGDDMVSGMVLRDTLTGSLTDIALDGVFIAVGNVPNSKQFAEIVERDKNGYIIADETGKTTTPGVFAAGDVRTKALRQIVTAAGDGANAIAAVERYLNSLV